MAFDGSGNYTVPGGTQGVPGATISATPYNAFLTDLQTALSKALLRDGQSAAQANVPMGGFKLTGLAAGTANGESTRFEQLTAHPAAAYTPEAGLPYSANLTLNASLTNVHVVGTLIGNVTGFTITNPGSGQTLVIRFAQDATGGRTVVAPTGAAVVDVIDSRPNAVSHLVLTYFTTAGRWEGSWQYVTP